MSDPTRVLLVEDDERLRTNVMRYLTDKGYVVHGYPNAEQALPAVSTRSYQVALVDYRLPGIDGIEFLRKARAEQPELPFVLMTAHGDVRSAVEAMKAGAEQFLEKPVEPSQLVEVIERVAEKPRLRDEVERLRHELDARYGFERIIGQSPRMRQVFDRIRLAAPTNSTILITGETGTGKELVARAIHNNSARKKRPFVAVNCAALPDTLIDSELFGHERGAFTGATATKKGYFEAASGGTLFIDEIGELAHALQAKLLRALEQRVITRIGSTAEIPIDVRILAATNRDLRRAVTEGRFRDDLFYRLSVVTIDLPPLRDRRSDIPLLVSHFLRELAAEHGRKITEIDDRALDALEHYPWPGNIRELRNTLESIVVLSSGEVLRLEDLPAHILRGESPEELADTERAGDVDEAEPQGDASVLAHRAAGDATRLASRSPYAGKTLEQIEREVILEALERSGGNKTQAARDLGIAVRTIQRKLAQYEGGPAS